MTDGGRGVLCTTLVLMLLSLVPAARGEWRAEYAQNAPEVQQWFKDQQLNPATKERLGVSWNGCCEKGDVFRTQFRVGGDNADQWWYWKGDQWKRIPDDVIHWGQHAPDKRATLFIYTTGQELCFYPPEEGI